MSIDPAKNCFESFDSPASMSAAASALHFFIPGMTADPMQCQWLVQASILRATCRACHVSLDTMGNTCLSWLRQHDLWHKTLSLETVPQMRAAYCAHQVAMLQRCILRAAQISHAAIIAGSYPAALFLQSQSRTLDWTPTDIDVWIRTTEDFEQVVETYENGLTTLGIQFTTTCRSNTDYPSDHDTDSDESVQELTAPNMEECVKTSFAEDCTPEVKRLREALQENASMLPKFGRKRNYDIVDTAKVRVLGAHNVRDFNVIHVDVHDNVWNAETICNSFDLSCCAVAAHICADLRANLACFGNSQQDLLNNEMSFLPCSFSHRTMPITVQFKRAQKYADRGFNLIQAR